MSELASQRVFNLLDLVEIICEHTSVRAPDGEFLDKKPLKNLAKVNRVARHAALWRLWRNVNGLDKILSLLPPERDLTLSNITGNETNNFHFFTNMITSFHAWSYGDHWERLPMLEQLIRPVSGNTPSFANLQELGLPWLLVGSPRLLSALPSMLQRDRSPWPNALSVFPPGNIRKLSLHLDNAVFPTHAPLMASIGARFPRLISLDISNFPIGIAWKDGISAGVRGIPHLRELMVNVEPSIIETLIADLKYFRELRILHMELHTGHYFHTPDTNVQEKGISIQQRPDDPPLQFPLDVFLTGNDNVGQVESAVSALSANSIRLASLSVSMDLQAHRENPLLPITGMIAKNYPDILHLTLRYFTTPPKNQNKPNIFVISADLLVPLLPLINITELDIRTSSTMILDKDTLHSIQGQWPSIRFCHFSLEVYPLSISTSHKLPNLVDVVTFASRCRYLRTLGIVLDATAPPKPEETLNVFSKTLASLNVGSSPISDSRYAAKIIGGGFPLLDDLLWTTEEFPRELRMRDEERTNWEMVRSLVFLKIAS